MGILVYGTQGGQTEQLLNLTCDVVYYLDKHDNDTYQYMYYLRRVEQF